MLSKNIYPSVLMTSRFRSLSFSRKDENLIEGIKTFIVEAGEIPGINESVLVIPVLNGEDIPEIGKRYNGGWAVCSYVYKEDRSTICYALCCK